MLYIYVQRFNVIEIWKENWELNMVLIKSRADVYGMIHTRENGDKKDFAFSLAYV